MKEFMLIVGLIACGIGTVYVGWKAFQYIVYRLSNLVAKGIYDAKNGKDVEDKVEKPHLPKMKFVCRRPIKRSVKIGDSLFHLLCDDHLIVDCLFGFRGNT